MASRAGTFGARTRPVKEESRTRGTGAWQRLLTWLENSDSDAVARKDLAGWTERAELGRETGARC